MTETEGSMTVATVPGSSRRVARAPELAGDEPADLVGKKVDRYLVLARLGAGGMGVVYAAHDPALDRRVALKVLPPLDRDQGSHLETRLRREAQALARLDHPNVIGVHDVGVAEQSVFIAMQLVDGATLADHLAAIRPGPREILALFVAAGRGLAAAHAAGIVHRDVKPSNVLVDRSGCVFVGDFGLARSAGEDEPAGTGSDSGSLLDESMTRLGTVLGTPLYMAPEQHRGEPATALSDQFSFCVSLWQALFETHPFHPGGPWVLATVMTKMARDEVRDPTRTRRVSPRVVRALRRGLRHAPGARWPSMDALLAALTPRSRAGWVWGGLAVGGIAGAVVLTTMLTGDVPDRRAACRAGADRIGAVWPGRADELRAALVGSGLPEAEGTADRVIAALGRYTDRWRTLRLDACEAAEVRGEVTPALRDVQLRCLDDDLEVTRELIADLEAGDRRLHARAVDVVSALPSLDDCATTAMASLPPPPAAHLLRISQLRAVLARARLLYDGDQLDAAAALIDPAVAEAETIGYAPLLAQALLGQAQIRKERSSPDAAALAARAAELATAARADRTAALAYNLGLSIAAGKPDLKQVENLTSVARAAARRTEDLSIYAAFAVAAGSGAVALARYDEAIALCTEADQLFAQDPGITSLSPLSCLVVAHLSRGDVEGAARWADAEIARAEGRYGRGTASMVGPMRRLAAVRRRQGRLDDAVALFEQALDIDERAFGGDTADHAVSLIQLAQVMHQSRRIDDGLGLVERALAILDRVDNPGYDAINANTTMAQLLRAAGRRDEMHQRYQAALTLGEQVLAPDDANLASLRFSYGSALAEDKQYERGLSLITMAGDALERAKNPRAAMAQVARAEILQEQGRCAEAVPVFETAVTALTQSGADAPNLQIARFNLADCLWVARVDRARARAIVVEVRAAAATMGQAMEALLAECDVWLGQHRL